jgi:hypothetical protein
MCRHMPKVPYGSYAPGKEKNGGGIDYHSISVSL